MQIVLYKYFGKGNQTSKLAHNVNLLVLLVLLCQPDYLFTPLYLFIYFFNYLFQPTAHGKFGFSSGNN